ncbi:MAG: hypothetical protein C4308_10980 [Chitinophagaceae bacterium]
MSTIEARLLALEKQNRRYKKIFFGMGAIAVGFGFMAFTNNPVPEKLQAKNFELVDNSNKVLASMTPYNGSGRITTFNAQGQKQLDFRPSDQGGGALAGV